jgi:dienelactone hydrolase
MNGHCFMRSCLLILATLLSWGPARGEENKPETIDLRECLAIRPVGRYGRSPIHVDPIEAAIVAGKWQAPTAGDKVKTADGGERTWEKIKAGNDGVFQHQALAGGYAYFSVPSDKERILILEASGHSAVYVNGELGAGDPYSNGIVHLPVQLKKGTNDLLFLGSRAPDGRGWLRVKLTTPRSAYMIDLADTTLPDLIVGKEIKTKAAVVVINATTTAIDKTHEVTLSSADSDKIVPVMKLPPIPPLGIRKVGFDLIGPAPTVAGKREIVLQLAGSGTARPDSAKLTLDVKLPRQLQRRTFVSDIDGSVQYYAINPAQPLPGSEGTKLAMFLTLHGAGVEGYGQAAAYNTKTWGHIVAPTNRRPFGFDWEDWGRLDALEVLAHAQKELKTDPQRVYLTGHSMGGHGVWHLGATYPDRFAAIGPSAGWISMFSYAGMRRPEPSSPLAEILQRCTTPSDTLALSRNYTSFGIYVLHGEKDESVPVDQARTMRKHLAEFHHDFQYHEQPGAIHWWGGGDEGCVDWPPMFDFFARHRLPTNESVRQVDFITASPGISSRCFWASIEAQLQQLKPSTIHLRYDPGARRFSGTTDNVARVSLDIGHVPPGNKIAIELDKQKLEFADQSDRRAHPHRLSLQRTGQEWSLTAAPSLGLKGPHRYGTFKDAFRHRVQFVYGTKGTAEENAWALARARLDAERFWYQGNASVDVIADSAFDPQAERDRNVILYGNADTNAAWPALLSQSPVQVRRDSVRVDEREQKGDGLACLFLRPRPGSDRACVGVVSGSGLPGMRLTDRLPYFVSGVACPDCLILGLDTLESGIDGVRCAGFFGLDWSVKNGEFAWKP